jgi:predicted TIM-barrel fold metal-dependent hydrolase
MSGYVDGHHHIWKQADLPWLNGPTVPRIFGDYESIKRDYPVAEFALEARAAGVSQSVYVQVNWAPERAVDEVFWAQSVAEAEGFPHGIVGYADLSRDDAMDVVDSCLDAPNYRGVRMQLHWHENPLYRFAPDAAQVADPQVIANLRRLAERSLVFELQVFTGQLENALRTVDAVPELQFVLEHAGMPEDDSPEGQLAWEKAIDAYAERPNVSTKLSGLGTFRRANEPDLIARIVRRTVAAFGADRCLWGSNFPIEKIWTDYDSLLSAHLEALSPFGEKDRAAIMGGTARRIYRLEDA